MKKYALSFLFLLMIGAVLAQKKPPGAVVAQKKSKVLLVSSESANPIKYPNGTTWIKVYKGTFQQDFSTLTSDSAYFYADKNAVDAFGHVVIHQGDTLTIFSDKLNYNGNTKLAILTDHVTMIDKGARLTTNYLTYNTATRIANYTGGGRLVNEKDTLVSKNGYYFAFSRDAYFRYNVVCTTTDALIKTDTMRYNSGTRITYFYGPTHIYGKKDHDTLYTEDGTYNNIKEQARFGKKNLYSKGSMTLKGDSLFYDRTVGYGRAVKNITYNDNEQKITIKGNLGEYYKYDEKTKGENTVVTQGAYAIIVTEQKDSTETDSAEKKTTVKHSKADSLAAKIPSKNTMKGVINNLMAQSKAKGNMVQTPAQLKTDSALAKLPAKKETADSLIKSLPTHTKTQIDSAIKANAASIDLAKGMAQPTIKNASPQAKARADSVARKLPGQLTDKNKTAMIKTATAADKNKVLTGVMHRADSTAKASLNKKPVKVKLDSIFWGADTLETRILTFKDLKALQKAMFDAANPDTSVKKVVHPVFSMKQPKFLSLDPPSIPADTSYHHRLIFGKPKPMPVAVKKPAKAVKPIDRKKFVADSIKSVRIADSLAVIANHGLVDTSRVRIISGHHHSKIFKSDLQAKSDSMFYSYSDSTIRCYVHPIIWTQGSQLSGDTIYLQLKNRQLDNMDMFPNGFIVNVEQADTVHFNQMGGRTIHGTFKDNKLNTILVNGNGETRFFNRDTVKHKVTEMETSVSGRIFIRFKNNQLTAYKLLDKVDQHAFPMKKVKEEDMLLKAFIWKPRERPKSKYDIISPAKTVVTKKTSDNKAAAAKVSKPATGKTPLKKPFELKTGKDTSAKPSGNRTPVLKPKTDTMIMIKADTLKKSGITMH